MRNWICIVALWGIAVSAKGDLLVNQPSDTAYVSSSQNGQGYSSGAVAWSLASPRSPISGYSGEVYYGGMTGSLTATVAGLGVANSTPDYLNGVTTSGGIGEWVVIVPMFNLAQASSLTNLTFTPRLTGSATQQTNYTRIVIEQNGTIYASGTNWYYNSNPQTWNNAALTALNWYTYDPTANMLGNAAAPASGVTPTNVTAVGVLFYNENKVVRGATIGASAFQIWGDAIAPPASTTNRLMHWDATNSVGGTQNGNGTWSLTHDNWLQNGVGADLAWSNDTLDRAVFQSSGAGMWTVRVAAATTITNIGLSFLTDGAVYEIGGSGVLFMEADSVITANAAAVISAPIAGTAFTKTGARTLVLAGTNTFSGILTITGGALQVGMDGNAGNLGYASVKNEQSLIIARNNTYSFTNHIYGSGTLFFTNSGISTWHGNTITQDIVQVMGAATFQQSAGRIEALTRIEVSASDPGSEATLRLQGGTMVAPSTVVGRATSGFLAVESGGKLQLTGSGSPAILSFQSGGTGRVDVTGGGSWIDAPQGTFAIGNGYPATLGIGQGGLLTISNLTVNGLMQVGGGTGLLSGQLTLANNAGEQTRLNLDDAESSLFLTNAAANVAGIFVGNHGNGIMNVTNGTVETGTLYVPVGPGTGTLNIAGGSVITRSSMILGNVGPGELTLSEGRLETRGNVVLGQSGISTSLISGGIWNQQGSFQLNNGSVFRQTGGEVTNGSASARAYQGTTELSGGEHILTGGGSVSVAGNFTLSQHARFVNTSVGSAAYLLLGGTEIGASVGHMTLSGGSFIMTNSLGLNDDLLIAPYSFNTGVVDIAGATAMVRVVSMGGIPTINLPFHRATNTYASLTMSAGALYLERGFTNSTQSSQSILLFSGGRIGALGSWGTQLDIQLASTPGTGTLSIDPATYTISLNGVLSGTGNLQKDSTGILRLYGVNTYNGATTINAGTVDLRSLGSIANSPLISVAEGATLSVTGRVDGTLNLHSGNSLAGSGSVQGHVLLDGGTLIPGASPGILSVSSLTMISGAYRCEITNAVGTPGADWDLVSVGGGAGTVDLTGASTGSITVQLESAYSSLSDFPISGNASWKIVDAGTVTGFNSNLFTITTADFYPVQKYDVTFSVSEASGDLYITTTLLTNLVDLAVSIGTTTNNIIIGETNAVMVVITNNSTDTSGSYLVTNTLSSSVSYVVATSTTNPYTLEVTHYTADGGVFSGGIYLNGTYSGGVVVWTQGDLAPGTSTNLTLFALQTIYSGSTQQVNNVIETTISTTLPDPNTGNNSASTSFTSVGIPMLSDLGLLALVAVILFAFYRRHHRAKRA